MPKNAKEQVKNKAPVNSTRGCSSRFLQAVRLVGRGSIGHQWVVQGARNSEVAMNVASEPKKSPTANDLNLPDRYWRAAIISRSANLSAGQSAASRAAPEGARQAAVMEHWGTTPSLNFITAHLNRVIRTFDVDVLYVCRPRHGASPAWSPTRIWKAATARSTWISSRPMLTERKSGLTSARRFAAHRQ
jgi:hypothetical protein